MESMHDAREPEGNKQGVSEHLCQQQSGIGKLP